MREVFQITTGGGQVIVDERKRLAKVEVGDLLHMYFAVFDHALSVILLKKDTDRVHLPIFFVSHII